MKETKYLFKLFAAALFILLIGGFIGKWIVERNMEKIMAENSIIVTNILVGALLHLEKNKLDYTRDLLFVGIDNEISKLIQLEDVSVDEAASRLRIAALKNYAEIRKKYPRPENREIQTFYDNIDQYVQRYKKELKGPASQ